MKETKSWLREGKIEIPPSMLKNTLLKDGSEIKIKFVNKHTLQNKFN